MDLVITLTRTKGGYICADGLGIKGDAHTTTAEAVSSLLKAMKNRHDRLSDVPDEFISEEGRKTLAMLLGVFRPVTKTAE